MTTGQIELKRVFDRVWDAKEAIDFNTRFTVRAKRNPKYKNYPNINIFVSALDALSDSLLRAMYPTLYGD